MGDWNGRGGPVQVCGDVRRRRVKGKDDIFVQSRRTTEEIGFRATVALPRRLSLCESPPPGEGGRPARLFCVGVTVELKVGQDFLFMAGEQTQGGGSPRRPHGPCERAALSQALAHLGEAC